MKYFFKNEFKIRKNKYINALMRHLAKLLLSYEMDITSQLQILDLIVCFPCTNALEKGLSQSLLPTIKSKY